MEETKTILNLCGGTGAWSKPYREAGYDVRLVTLPDQDVRDYIPPETVYGILAAPPCTEFAGSGARWWKDKPPELLQEALHIVNSCLEIIRISYPVFWCLENPVGRLVNYLGTPVMYFNPCDFGDPWTKKTCLWGVFNPPAKSPVEPVGKNPIHHCPPGPKRQEFRSITPAGFANAFFRVNQ